MKYFLITYGCQMNRSDSERIAVVLENKGYKPAQKIDGADLIVVNMCSVRQSAVDRVFGKIRDFAKLKAQNSKLKTILTGCLLKKDKNKLSKLFDLILDINYLPKWPEILDYKKPKIISGKKLLKSKNYFEIEPKYSNKFSALVPIMTGCNNFCAYCVVPYVRGREISRPAEEIVCEIKRLIKQGCKEIWLLGQNVNSYNNKQRTMNNEQKIGFPKLLKMVNDIPGEFWIRFTSSHPKDFSDGLIKIMKDCKKVTPYLNLPVQTGDDEILKRMNRPYTITQYKKIINKIRKEIPSITLSTDVIVGFPGETKKQFENTAKLFKELKYDMAYIAKYSPRAGTAAVKLKDNVPQKEKSRREKILTEILKQTALENNEKYIGKEVEVLMMDNSIGKTRTNKTVKINSKKNLSGKFVKVKITNALAWSLKGEYEKD